VTERLLEFTLYGDDVKPAVAIVVELPEGDWWRDVRTGDRLNVEVAKVTLYETTER
jgi:hypothetical protein